MTREEALKRAAKLLGVRVDQLTTRQHETGERDELERAARVVELRGAREVRHTLEDQRAARAAELLGADPLYQELTAKMIANKADQVRLRAAAEYRCELYLQRGIGLEPKGYGVNWKATVDDVERRLAAESAARARQS